MDPAAELAVSPDRRTFSCIEATGVPTEPVAVLPSSNNAVLDFNVPTLPVAVFPVDNTLICGFTRLVVVVAELPDKIPLCCIEAIKVPAVAVAELLVAATVTLLTTDAVRVPALPFEETPVSPIVTAKNNAPTYPNAVEPLPFTVTFGPPALGNELKGASESELNPNIIYFTNK